MSRAQFAQSYQLAPIILVNGLYQNAPNGQASILMLTEGTETPSYTSSADYFAQFKPMAGGTLIDFSPAMYPFASMNMAANAVLQEPLRISMLMECPIRTGANNYIALQQTITRIQTQLQAHILAGGTFTVATPGFIYQNCLLTGLRDVTPTGDKKVQGAWQWDFLQPLITPQAAEQTYNAIMNKLAGQLPVPNPPTNSGIAVATGNTPANQQSGT